MIGRIEYLSIKVRKLNHLFVSFPQALLILQT